MIHRDVCRDLQMFSEGSLEDQKVALDLYIFSLPHGAPALAVPPMCICPRQGPRWRQHVGLTRHRVSLKGRDQTGQSKRKDLVSFPKCIQMHHLIVMMFTHRVYIGKTLAYSDPLAKVCS